MTKVLDIRRYGPNIFGLLAGSLIGLKRMGFDFPRDDYNELRDIWIWSADPVSLLEKKFGVKIRMACPKPVDKMSKKECEEEWEFTFGAKKVFSNLNNARAAISKLIKQGKCMSFEEMQELMKRPAKKKPKVSAPQPMAWKTGHAKPEKFSQAEATEPEPQPEAENPDKPAKKAKVQKPVKAEATGGVYEFESLSEIGGKDQISLYLKEYTTGGLPALCKDNGLDDLSAGAPNGGVAKMRVGNKLRAMVKHGEKVKIAGVVFKLAKGVEPSS